MSSNATPVRQRKLLVANRSEIAGCLANLVSHLKSEL
jgi:hypothetical protein